MPEHKGIKLSIFSQVEQTIHAELPHLHPEFPHPETSQFTYRSPDVRQSLDWTPPSAGSDSKADRLLGRESSVAVYIPSVPGTRFWIRYNIEEWATTNCQWYFFKLFMNGRQVTSWGTNARTNPSGQIMKGLFDPSELWNYDHNGTMYKNMGLEERSFVFAFEDKDNKPSAAMDGGLIEVKVYRARGRSRMMPTPLEFKSQDGYGIVMPSQGLVDRPQDAKFYDWHLKDPKDWPYASFKFHYRSWGSLQSLHLIPSDHPRSLLPPSASVLSLVGFSRVEHEKLKEEAAPTTEDSPTKASETSETSEASAMPWLTSVFDDIPDSAKSRDKREFVVPSEIVENYSLRFPVPAPTSKFSAAVIDKPSPPRGSPTPQNVNRPLPQIPSRKSSLKHRRNVSSVSTNAPSVAASLKSYIDRDSPSPEPAEIGIAEAVDVRLTSQIVGTTEWSGDTGFIESLPVDEPSSNSPLTEIATKRQGMALSSLSTEPVIFALPNVTIRKLRLSGGKNSPVRKTSPAKDEIQRKDENSPLIDNQATLALTESEWMCRTPSPLKKSQEEEGVPLTKLWSPGIGANRKSLRRRSEESVESAGSVLHRRASILDRQVPGIPEEDADDATRQEFDDEIIRSGNWI